MAAIEFGYYPKLVEGQVDDIQVSTLPDHQQVVSDVLAADEVEGRWFYAPRESSKNIMSGRVSEHPYSARVFALPKTHSLEHANADSEEHLSFLMWVLGFIVGMRLTETEAGFLDATPIEPGELHDMALLGPDVELRALGHAERFWQAESAKPRVAKGVTAIIHSFFLAQYPKALGFERFTYLYVALDGCHFVHSLVNGKDPKKGTHRQRIKEICNAFGIVVPKWAGSQESGNIVDKRNETLHEGLFFDEPLGFSVYGGHNRASRQGNTILEMQNLVSRLLCGLLGLPDQSYIQSPVNDRQQHGMTL